MFKNSSSARVPHFRTPMIMHWGSRRLVPGRWPGGRWTPISSLALDVWSSLQITQMVRERKSNAITMINCFALTFIDRLVSFTLHLPDRLTIICLIVKWQRRRLMVDLLSLLIVVMVMTRSAGRGNKLTGRYGERIKRCPTVVKKTKGGEKGDKEQCQCSSLVSCSDFDVSAMVANVDTRRTVQVRSNRQER